MLQPGLYVLGLINSSSASKAGLQQGDQLVAIEGTPVLEQSPFQAAALIAGRDSEDPSASVSITVRPRHPPVMWCRQTHSKTLIT